MELWRCRGCSREAVNNHWTGLLDCWSTGLAKTTTKMLFYSYNDIRHAWAIVVGASVIVCSMY